MRRYSHDRTSTITHHYIVCNKDRDLFTVNRIDCLQAFDLHTRLVFYKLGTLKLRLLCTLGTICFDGIHVGDAVCIFIDQRMLWSHYHEGNPEQGIRSGRIDLQLLVYTIDLEINKCTGGFTDPVHLLLFYICRIIYILKTCQQFVSILRDS